jgi:signal transduction histidine kinase
LQQAATGFGLRLTIVSEIARAHGETIEVNPVAATNMFFTFRMPL